MSAATVTVVVVRGADGRAVRMASERHGGVVGPSRPGEAVASFGGAGAAVQAAVDLCRGSMDAAVGLAVGEGEDRFPATAVAGARALCESASPGQILCDGLVRMLAGSGDGYSIEPLGEGWEVAWEPGGPEAAIRVVVADDTPLVRGGVVRLLIDEGFDVVGEAADADELLVLVERERPDLVVTDIRMPPTNTDDGLRAAAAIRAAHPSTAVLVLSQHVEVSAAAGLLDDQAAGVGYLLKERVAAIDEFGAICRTVAAGGRVVDEVVAEELVRRRTEDDPVERLSDREREVLALMAQGRSNAGIASALHLSPKTLETHVRSIFTKLGLLENPDEHRRVAAVVRWLERRDRA